MVGFQSENHPQQKAVRGSRASVDDRATTVELFSQLDARFFFFFDVAASPHNTKCERFYDKAANGLAQSWEGERVWCNPPYSDIRPWLAKAWLEDCPIVVMILPANRTEQGWWQDLVEPYRDRAGSPLTVEFLKGRIRFIGPDATKVGPNERPPFGCCLLVWNREKPPHTIVTIQEEALLVGQTTKKSGLAVVQPDPQP